METCFIGSQMTPKSTSNHIKLSSYEEKTLRCRHYPALPYLPTKLASTLFAMLTRNMPTYPLHSSTLHYKVNFPLVCIPMPPISALRFFHSPPHFSNFITTPSHPLPLTRQDATEALSRPRREDTKNGGPVHPYTFGRYFFSFLLAAPVKKSRKQPLC